MAGRLAATGMWWRAQEGPEMKLGGSGPGGGGAFARGEVWGVAARLGKLPFPLARRCRKRRMVKSRHL